jgi:hypothetical protein
MNTQMSRRIEMADQLMRQQDSISRAIAGSHYEAVRRYCRENPDDIELSSRLPRGYQLVPLGAS